MPEITAEILIDEIKKAGDQSAQAMVAQYKDRAQVEFWRGQMAMAESIIMFYEANKDGSKTPTELKVVPKEESVSEPS